MIVFEHLIGWRKDKETVRIEVVQKDLCIIHWGAPPNATKFYIQKVERIIGIDDIEIRGTCAKRDNTVINAPFIVRITKDSFAVRGAGPFGMGMSYEFPEGQTTRTHTFARLKNDIQTWKIDG